MSEVIKYRSAFLKSKQHAILAGSTIGLGLMFGHFFPLILGVIGYMLGWIYIPDMPFFKKAIDDKNNNSLSQERAAQVEIFVRKRDALLANLPSYLKTKYKELAGYCQDIERETSVTNALSGTSTPDVRVKKLDELMWTYLRLLCMEQSLTIFLNTEKEEYVQQQVTEIEEQLFKLTEKSNELPENKRSAISRIIQSKTSMAETLKRRLERVSTSRENIELVKAEQERLVEQIRLLRADSFAMQNSEMLSQRIDASVDQLAETNKWLAEMDILKDTMDSGMPLAEGRIGYGVSSQTGTSFTEEIIDGNYSSPKRISIKRIAN